MTQLAPYLHFTGNAREHLPLQETFWGARYGEVTDRFGIGWMFNCAKV